MEEETGGCGGPGGGIRMGRGGGRGGLLVLALLVGIFAPWVSPEHIDKRFEPRTVDQCFGQTIPIQCDPGFMVQVTKVFYRQSQQCHGSFHSNFCTREEPSNPACVGNETCVFTTPYIYLSPECGYSNNFLVTYKCIPANLPRDICLEGTITASSGYIISPSYPAKYPAGKNCKVTLTTAPGTLIQIYLLDLYLAYYNYDVTKQCVDTLWVVGQGEQDRTSYLCSGQQRGLVFTSKTNRATVYFTSKGHRFLNAKGFWLFFQAVSPSTTNVPSIPTTAPQQTSPTLHPVQPSDTVHSLREITNQQMSENQSYQKSEVKNPDRQEAISNQNKAVFKESNPLSPSTAPPTFRPTQPTFVVNRPVEAVTPTTQTVTSVSNEKVHQDRIAVLGLKSQSGLSTNPASTAGQQSIQINHSTASMNEPVSNAPQQILITQKQPLNITPSPNALVSQIVGVTPGSGQVVINVSPSPAIKVATSSPAAFLHIDQNQQNGKIGAEINSKNLDKGLKVLKNNESGVVGTVEMRKNTELPEVPTTSSRLKVPLWSIKEQPSHAAVFFKKMSDTTRKGIVGGAGGCLVLMLAVIVVVILIKRRRNNKIMTPPLQPTIKPDNYDDIILAYGSTDTTKGFVNVGFENESIHDFPLDSSSQNGSGGSLWGGTLTSCRGLNPIDEGPEIVYMDAKTATLGGGSGRKKNKKGNKVRWVKSKSLDDIRHTIRYTQRQMVRGSLQRKKDGDSDREPFSVSLVSLGDDDNSSIPTSAASTSRLSSKNRQYTTMANLNMESCMAQSETTIYSNPSTLDTSSSPMQPFSFCGDMSAKDNSPYETVHFQHQEEVAL